jgi:predicted nucleic acid-binding protein
LIALSLLELLDEVVSIFDLVTTETVVEEWRSCEGEVPQGVRILEGSIPSDPMLSTQLDSGEASVILAAGVHDIGNVLIDETKGRKMARQHYGLRVIGTVRVLVELRKAGHIGRIQPYLEKLLEHGYWLSPTVVSWALVECRENPDPGME